jgi:PKD repeat protein
MKIKKHTLILLISFVISAQYITIGSAEEHRYDLEIQIGQNWIHGTPVTPIGWLYTADPDLVIESIVWDWGDETTTSGTYSVQPEEIIIYPDEHIYAETGSYNVYLYVTTNVGTLWADTYVTVVEPEIYITQISPQPLQTFTEISAHAETGEIYNPANFFSATWDWGDGTTTPSILSYNPEEGPFVAIDTDSQFYTEPGEYTVTLTLYYVGGTVTQTQQIQVYPRPNTPPIADANGPYEVNEGDLILFDGSGSTDLDDDEIEYRWDFEDDGTWNTDWSTDPTADNMWLDDWTGTTRLEISDGVDTITDTATVTVQNVSPQVSEITAPIEPVPLDTIITVSSSFSDPGLEDTHQVNWDWGDESSDTYSDIQGPISQTHVYTLPGVYTITLSVTDDEGDSTSITYEFVVVFNQYEGFTTGAGLIDSLEGAYKPDVTSSGIARFGFISKYLHGTNVPTGSTDFVFRVADLRFRSTSYDWLVVAGNKAKFKGTGTINGLGNYGFMLTATDGDVDLFRIKIWDKDTDLVVYDNKFGSSDDSYTGQELKAGNINIQNN